MATKVALKKVIPAKKKVSVKAALVPSRAKLAKAAAPAVVGEDKPVKPIKGARVGKVTRVAKPVKAAKPVKLLKPSLATKLTKIKAADKAAEKVKVRAAKVAEPSGDPSSALKKRLNPNNLLPANLPPIDMRLDLSKRRMGGFDIEAFRARHHLTILDVVYALALHPYPHLQKTSRLEVLPYPTELLIRLYDAFPGPAPWKSIKPRDMFEMFYGEALAKFKNTEWANSAQLAMYRRFAALFSRDVATTYRWMSGGEVRVEIEKIMSKLLDTPNPRETLEDMARLTWKNRGLNFDENFPMPTLENPPVLKARGRKKKPLTIGGGTDD